MNILISSASYIFSDHIPGGERQIVHAIISRLAARGHQLYVLVPFKRLRREIPNVTVYEIGRYDFDGSDSYWNYHWNWWKFSAMAYWRAKELCKRKRIDVIHHLLPAFSGKFSLCWKLGVPFVYGPLFLSWKASSDDEAVRWRRHHRIDPLLDRVMDRLNMTLGRYLWKRTVAKASSLPVSVRKALDLLPRERHQDAPLISLGVDTDRFRPALAPGSQQPEVLFAGNLEHRKGVDHLLRALSIVIKHIPDAYLTLLGTGRNEAKFKRLAEEMGISGNVSFKGAVPFDQVVTYYQGCRVFCLPSLGEPFGISLLQAMACGKPVISTRAGGVPEFVEDGRSGILVPPGDVERLADALLALLRDPDLCHRIGAYNRQLCLELYSWDVVVGRIESIYRNVIGCGHL